MDYSHAYRLRGHDRRSRVARRRHHDPHQVRGVAGAELLHDVSAMILDGARTDAELPPGLLVGGAGGELLEHLAFASRQRFASWEMQRGDPRGGVLRLPSC